MVEQIARRDGRSQAVATAGSAGITSPTAVVAKSTDASTLGWAGYRCSGSGLRNSARSVRRTAAGTLGARTAESEGPRETEVDAEQTRASAEIAGQNLFAGRRV